MNKRPTFFISSTVLDFADLRSAIKFNLERIGCRVLASETNDFGNDLDKHSYEACLKQIDLADYFILLIGSRVGGWYDEGDRISITRAEYRYAYEKHKQGKLKIIPFVRQSVWDVREDRKALLRHIENMALQSAEKQELSQINSKFLSDPSHIIDFIKEVGRNEDTKLALKTDGEKPTGNWIYTFNYFSEIHDVLSTSVFRGENYARSLQFKNLRKSLFEILTKLHVKLNGKVVDINISAKNFMKNYPLNEELDRVIEFDASDSSKFVTVVLSLGRPKLDTGVLLKAVEGRIFDTFDYEAGVYCDTQASRDLSKLYESCRFLSIQRESFLTTLFGENPQGLDSNKRPIRLPTLKLLELYGEITRRENIRSLSLALLAHTNGTDYISPELLPASPIHSMNEELEKEKVTHEDIASHYDI